MRKIIILGSLFAVVLMSCGEAESEEISTYPNYAPPAITAPQAGDSLPAPLPPIQMAPTTPQAAPGAEVRINPPHGQPGHSCDVEVGAPLPPAGSGTSNTTINGPSPMMVPNQGAPVAQPAAPPPPMQLNPNANGSGAKLNPPHGQPGHRCEIAVGAPLN